MAETSKIEWTEATWNPITGCSLVSSGCQNCYAMRLAGGRLKNHSSRRGLTTETPNGPVWNGEVRFNENWLDQPTIWREPKRIFVVAHGDLFHEKVPFEWIDRVFDIMTDDKCQHHTFQVLTKRPERMKEYVAHAVRGARTRLSEEMEAAAAEHLARYQRGGSGVGREENPAPGGDAGTRQVGELGAFTGPYRSGWDAAEYCVQRHPLHLHGNRC